MFLFIHRKQKPLLGVGEQPVDPLFIALSSEKRLFFLQPPPLPPPPIFIDKRTWFRSILGAHHADLFYPYPFFTHHEKRYFHNMNFSQNGPRVLLKLYYFSD
ncbi:hypothetical protein CEXT_214671 [Caerostris extrusa]|uniref:Uncharacterized protein n=1 Tax=Caerostris extrusa TaxID=172846 RepID=A0AAV4PJW5_CAEEX|nr:hypothetical protein CEXT_214671 [Caerostris extrusa]